LIFLVLRVYYNGKLNLHSPAAVHVTTPPSPTHHSRIITAACFYIGVWKMTDSSLVSTANAKEEKSMWNRLIVKIVLAFLGSIDWVAIARKILERMSDEVREQLGVSVDLNRLDLNRLFAILEEVLNDYCKMSLDLNKDGKIGDGKEG